ncbi:MAG: UDP-N-acetylmuramoylalanine-D-glutamate ligase [Parcubacteria group bacterium GW2011_GWB1_43_8]|nr:MAG: UDP-N-acetylmuramoylalanine-D-glutamate ligase [Parcubacteria group bacterium GW2011_GWB1_43_8]
MNYKDFFAGKKITMIGLGILGRGVNIAKFLAECGTELTITDLKTKEQLASSLKILTPYKNIKYVLGRHNPVDFRDKDMVIKAAGVPLDSPYISEAQKNNIPVEMDASLFLKLLTTWTSDVQVVGITGTRGKSTVTHLIYAILKSAGLRVHLGGNVKGLATLPLLKKVKPRDVVVMELDSWQLQGFGDAKISPNIAVFTTFLPDHLNYYNGDMDRYFSDKGNIYRWQKDEDCLITGTKTAKLIKEKEKNGLKSRTIIVDGKNIPRIWKIKLLGEHNLENIALAVEAARKLGVKESTIKKSVDKFKSLPGRLEFIREVKGVKFYNDTTATTPEAVMAALDSLKESKGKIILIGGGADKNLEYAGYAKVVKKSVKALALFRGLASNKIISSLGKVKFPMEVFDNMKIAMKFAVANAKKGDIVLFSPGAASFGVFKNEFDRGGQFNKAAIKLI